DSRELASGRRMIEAEDLDRRPRARLLDLLAAIVVEGAHAAPGVAGDDRVAHPKGSALDEHGGDRAAADVQSRLDDRARSLERGVLARDAPAAGGSRLPPRRASPADTPFLANSGGFPLASRGAAAARPPPPPSRGWRPPPRKPPGARFGVGAGGVVFFEGDA